MSQPFRDFYYLDDQLIDLYFTQLPHPLRAKFHAEYASTAEVEFKASLSPSVETKRTTLGAPYHKAAAQLKYVEEYMREKMTLGDLETFEGRYLFGAVEVCYGGITTQAVNLFFAYPEGGSRERLRRLGKSYTILGDLDKCWYASSRPPRQSPDGSSLSRLVSLWGRVNSAQFRVHADAAPEPIEGSEKDTSYFRGDPAFLMGALHTIEDQLRNTALQGSFSGIFILRTPIVDEEKKQFVLYPLYLERVQRRTDSEADPITKER